MADEDTDLPNEGGGTHRIPPYIPFATFNTFLRELKTNGLPPRIDKSVMSKMSGGQQSQMKMALRSLGLIGDGDAPTDRLVKLVEAFDGPAFKPLIEQLLRETYPYVFKLDLMTATPAMFAESFKATGAKEDVLRKCRTFFLHGAKFVNLPLGQRLQTGSMPRVSSGGPRRKARKPKAEEQADLGQHNTPEKPDAILGQLLGKFPDFDPSWPDDLKKKWFEGFDQFMKKAATSQ